MNQTQRRRAEADVRLYNTDGRFHEIDEVPGVLEVCVRSCASFSL